LLSDVFQLVSLSQLFSLSSAHRGCVLSHDSTLREGYRTLRCDTIAAGT
jgi:hypothetical protein